MWYVYIIRSVSSPEQEYTGATADLKQRIADHNAGKSTHTASSSLGDWSGTAHFLTSTKRWNSRNISNRTPAAHLRKSVSDTFHAIVGKRSRQYLKARLRGHDPHR
jgi:hypothetical protein